MGPEGQNPQPQKQAACIARPLLKVIGKISTCGLVTISLTLQNAECSGRVLLTLGICLKASLDQTPSAQHFA